MNKHKNIKSYLTMLTKCFFAAIVAITILSIFCYFFSHSGTRTVNKTGATDFRWSSNEWRSTAFEGFSWFRMDENGFSNISTDNSKNPDILMMGSSHMEAANVGPKHSVANILSKELDLETYNIAMSGHTIYNCINNMNVAVNQYKPDKYLILETFDTELSINEMQAVIDGKFEKFESYDSGLLYQLQKYAPALKNIYKQIDVWKNGSNINVSGDLQTDTSSDTEENYEEVLNNFLLKAKSACDKSGAKLIIFYHPEIKIDENGNAYTEINNKQKQELFKSTCEQLGIVYVDMTKPFVDMYENDHIIPYGFYNTAVGAAHLNKHGHQAIAEELIKSISEDN